MNNCDEALDSMPNTVIAHVRAEGGEAFAVSVLENTWKWCGVTVPVIRDFLRAHVLATSMVFFTVEAWSWKHWGVASFFLGRKPHVTKMDVWARSST